MCLKINKYTLNRAMLRMVPTLRTYADPLTNAMVSTSLVMHLISDRERGDNGLFIALVPKVM